MSIYRVLPTLIESNTMSDGDVLTYVSANGVAEWRTSEAVTIIDTDTQIWIG